VKKGYEKRSIFKGKGNWLERVGRKTKSTVSVVKNSNFVGKLDGARKRRRESGRSRFDFFGAVNASKIRRPESRAGRLRGSQQKALGWVLGINKPMVLTPRGGGGVSKVKSHGHRLSLELGLTAV